MLVIQNEMKRKCSCHLKYKKKSKNLLLICYVQVYVSKTNHVGKPIFCKEGILQDKITSTAILIHCIYVCQESDNCIKIKQTRCL